MCASAVARFWRHFALLSTCCCSVEVKKTVEYRTGLFEHFSTSTHAQQLVAKISTQPKPRPHGQPQNTGAHASTALMVSIGVPGGVWSVWCCLLLCSKGKGGVFTVWALEVSSWCSSTIPYLFEVCYGTGSGCVPLRGGGARASELPSVCK